MTDDTVRVGIVGSGSMGARHAQVWSELGAEVIVYSPTPAHRERIAGATAVPTLTQLLRTAELVDICTPTDTHVRVALLAAGLGRPIVCEKPLARTPQQARALLAGVDVPFFVAHVLRYFRSHALARRRVRDGQVGELRSISLRRAVDAPPAESWLRDQECSGGVLLDLMIHDFDYARWVAGEVVSVRAQQTESAGITRAEAWLTHAGGVTSHVVGQWGGVAADSFELVGEHGVLRSGEIYQELAALDLGALAFHDQLSDFRAAVLTGEPTRVTAADGLAALEIACAAEESARTDTSVPVPAT